ncbi:E3 ubiquitin-protein ligase [Perilla frutescens var. hirtella]|nr:E3 ubiquitin-protein ligase [Perilla frutescens var. hirtella]
MKKSHHKFKTNPIPPLSIVTPDLARMNYKDRSPKLELKLNLSPPRQVESPTHESVSSAEVSPRSSCVSRETSPEGASSPESSSSMMLVGCPRCLMYVMLLEDDPKCPKCKSTVLLDFMHEDRARELKK